MAVWGSPSRPGTLDPWIPVGGGGLCWGSAESCQLVGLRPSSRSEETHDVLFFLFLILLGLGTSGVGGVWLGKRNRVWNGPCLYWAFVTFQCSLYLCSSKCGPGLVALVSSGNLVEVEILPHQELRGGAQVTGVARSPAGGAGFSSGLRTTAMRFENHCL